MGESWQVWDHNICMRVFHSVLIHEKPPSKGGRIRSSHFTDRLFVCPYFVVSCFSALSLGAREGLQSLIVTYPGDFFIIFMWKSWSVFWLTIIGIGRSSFQPCLLLSCRRKVGGKCYILQSSCSSVCLPLTSLLLSAGPGNSLIQPSLIYHFTLESRGQEYCNKIKEFAHPLMKTTRNPTSHIARMIKNTPVYEGSNYWRW